MAILSEETLKKIEEEQKKYPSKRWVVDGGALQEMDVLLLNKYMIITPHAGEFKRMFNMEATYKNASEIAKKYKCIVLLKGVLDIVCSENSCVKVEGGNEGMTKGGTGDVLAGLVSALYCKNESFIAAKTGSLINKSAGDRLYKRVGPYFNTSDLVKEVPKVIKEIVGY